MQVLPCTSLSIAPEADAVGRTKPLYASDKNNRGEYCMVLNTAQDDDFIAASPNRCEIAGELRSPTLAGFARGLRPRQGSLSPAAIGVALYCGRSRPDGLIYIPPARTKSDMAKDGSRFI
jgi:hypothetical protein